MRYIIQIGISDYIQADNNKAFKIIGLQDKEKATEFNRNEMPFIIQSILEHYKDNKIMSELSIIPID